LEWDEEILRRLLAMDVSGVRRLLSPSQPFEASESFGTSGKTGWPEIMLKFKTGGQRRPVLRGRLLGLAPKEFILLDERTGLRWGVSRAKWKPIRPMHGEARRRRDHRSADGEVNPATDTFRKDSTRTEPERRQEPLQRRRRKRNRRFAR
jgi:hypothetical protein